MLPVESLLEFLVIFLTFIMHSSNTALNLFHRGWGGGGGRDIRSVAVFLLLIQTIGFTGQFNTFFLYQSVALY